ncbi:MAG: hypothetical protein O2816_03875 [Planctomycetota bacterium]|nr:hypothetical protein [Planctomycetota bacterium]
MPPKIDAALAALVEALAVETDPVARARCLARAAAGIAPVLRASLWAQAGQRWNLIAQEGAGRPELGPDQLAAACAGEACLPSHHVLAQLGGRCLALEGLAPGQCTDEVRDQLEALLLTAAMDASPGAEELIDLILPALPGKERHPGTHAPGAADLTDLRYLLEHLAVGQQRIAQAQDAGWDSLEEGYERAGDLLLSGLEGHAPPGNARLDEVLDVLWGTLGRPGELDLEEEALVAPLAVAGGPLLTLLMLARRITGAPPCVPATFLARHEGDRIRIEITARDRRLAAGLVLDLRERARTHAVRVRIDAGVIRLWLPIERG